MRTPGLSHLMAAGPLDGTHGRGDQEKILCSDIGGNQDGHSHMQRPFTSVSRRRQPYDPLTNSITPEPRWNSELRVRNGSVSSLIVALFRARAEYKGTCCVYFV